MGSLRKTSSKRSDIAPLTLPPPPLYGHLSTGACFLGTFRCLLLLFSLNCTQQHTHTKVLTGEHTRTAALSCSHHWLFITSRSRFYSNGGTCTLDFVAARRK